MDDEEREISEAIDRAIDEGTLVDHLTPARKVELEEIARNTLEAMRHEVTAGISGPDYCKLNDKTRKLGTTREELLAQILHDYVEGRLVKAG